MALVCFVNGQHVDLGFAMHHVPQIKSRTQLQIACFKTPSSKRMGPRQPNCRTRSASDKSRSAIPSAARKASKTLSMPCPYALALTTPNQGIGGCCLNKRQVMAQGLQVNGGLNGSRHVGSFKTKIYVTG